MAFIDWLRKQHEESARNRALFEGRPRVAASQAWGGYQDRPGGQRLMVRQRPKVDNTLTIKDDGTRTHVKKWTDPDERTLRASALPPEPVMGPGRPLPPPRNQRNPFDIPQYGFPRGGLSPEAQAAIARVQATGGQNVDAYGDPIGVDVSNQRAMYHALRRPNPQVASIANIGMPRVADLRNRVKEIERQQFAIPRQQMPPPRFVPRVDPSQFPTVQDRGLGTYDIGDPRVQMGGGFDWTGQALRKNVGEDLRNVWNPISDRVKQMLEQIRKRREGQTMAPFDRGWY